MKHTTPNASSHHHLHQQPERRLLFWVQSARCTVVSPPGFSALSSEVGGGAAASIKRINNREESYVMEEKNDNRTKWLHLRLKPQEQEQIYRHFRQTTCREVSDYARKILLQKPVTTTYRNQSLDELMGELIVLRKELNRLGNNFNQAVKKLHTLSQLPEFRSWLLTWEQEEKLLQHQVVEIKDRMAKIETIWLQ